MANEGEGNDASYHTSFPLMTTAAGSGTAADPWSQGTGLQSETDFNCSHVTEQPQWEEDPVGVNAPQTYQHYEERSASIHGGKRRWRSFVDNTTGSTYYYDETTGESQWERPMDMHDEHDVADNWREDQGAAENTAKKLENDKVVETGVLDTACESLPERCQSIDGSGGEESASNRVMFSSGGEYLAPGELRRSSSREHGSMGAEEQPASHKSPTGAFTASRAPILEDGKFAKDFVPEDEPAMLDRLTRRDHLSYDRELNGGFIDARANEVNEKILNSVSEELEQLRVPQEESCLRDSVAARDELKFTSDSDALINRELVEVSGFSLETTGELITENGEANWSLQRSLNSRDRDQATGIALGASLLRVDSSSTLSTYGGGLDSLARYVAGHSSNLARSAFVELSIPTQDQECATRGDDEVQIVQPRNEGSLPHTPYHNRSSTVADSASESGDAPWNPSESMGNDVGNSAAPSTTQQLSCESTVDEVKQQPDESTNFTRDASALCSSPQVYSERHSWLGSLACEDANPGNRVAMTPATQVQDEVSQSLPPSSQTVLTYEQPPTPLAEDHASVAFNSRKAVNQSSSGSCPFAEEIGVESDGAVVHVERRNVDTPQKGAPPCALTENALERDSRSDADSDSRIQRMLGGQQFVDSPLVLIPTAGLSSVEVDRDGVSKAPTSDFIPAAVKLIETGESRIPLLSARKAPAAQSSASILDSGTSDTTVFQRVQTEALPTSRQEVATVTLQAKMRSWAARRRFARQVKHRVIRRREEFEATRLAAVAIQASVRGYIVRQRIKKPTEDHSSPDGKLECDAAGDPSSEKRKQDPIVPGDEGDIHVVDALSASKVLICHHQPHTLEMPVADCFDRGEASVLQMSKFLRPQTIDIEKQTVGYSSENIGQQVAADKIKIGSTRKLSSNTFIHEMTRKQDSREFRERRWKDSREMDTYARELRGPSLPREVSISEEDQQGSSSSRGQLPAGQSWSGEEPTHEISSGNQDSREFHGQRSEDSREMDAYTTALRGPSLPREVSISEKEQQGSRSSRGKLSDGQLRSGEDPTHEISSGKQDSREFHEQRRKGSREMNTYARALGGPSLPREVPISKEDQQGSSSSRGKLSDGQSWSGEEATQETLSGKQDSREFHEQRGEDSREMYAYAIELRGPSLPREGSISEEDQQGSSRCRGQLADGQSWSAEKPNHEISPGKQDSRECHEQRGEDSREMDTYTRAQRGPSFPGKVSISEENQQGSSSSRGQSSDRQSWSGEEAKHEALSGNQSSKEFHEQRRKDFREMDTYARELRKPSLPRELSISEDDQQGSSSSRGQFSDRQSRSGEDPTHEISSGKQDRRECHEQRGKDSREMDTYTRAQRGPSFPGEVSISEENHQGSSSSRGKLSDRQSWSSKEPSDTTTSLHRPLRANDRDEFKGLEDSSDDFTFELEGEDGKGGDSSQPGEHNEHQKDFCDLIDSKKNEERPHLRLARVSSDDNILREPSSQGSGGGTESDAPSKDCGVKRCSRRPIPTSRLTTDGDSQESPGVWRSSREKDVNAGTTAQGEVLETLRCVVDKQARSIAKLASTAPGTEASRCEVMRIRELAARQDQVAKDFLSTMESPIVSDSDADCALDHLGQSVGLMVWAVGVFEEIITHAIRSRVAPDPYVVGRVAGDIRRLTRLQERLVYQGIQRFDASARVAEFGNVDPDGDIADVAGVSKGGDQDGKVAVGAPQEWIARLTVDLMYKLRRKVDPGSVSSAHVDATRRECQVTRLANELRCIAASRARASTIITEAGPEFVAEASTAEPSRRNVIPLYGHRQTCEGKQILGKTPVIEDELSTVEKKNVSAADRVAITTAAEKEEIAAAKRILAFLRRRPRNKPATGSGAETASVDSTGVRIDAPSRSAKADAYVCDQGSGRFDAAIHTLHEAVDFVFRRNPSSGSKTLSTKFTPSSSSHEHRPEYRKCSEASREISDDTAKVRGRSKINNDNDETSDTIVSDSINEAPQSSGVEFPPVPLRARASPLYTLPASLVIRGGGSGNHNTTCSDKTKIDRVTELNRDVATRFSSVRSVFGLRASDVLAAFAPPLTSTSTAVPVPRLHISTPPATGGCDSPPQTPSPDALRQRLNAEAKDAFSAGVGQPLGSTRRLYLPVDHRPRLGLRRKIQPRRFDVQWDREQNSVRRIDTWGPVTALGRRLLVKRAQALTEARKQQMLGVVDALRVRQAGRQLRSGAAANALDAVLHALDARDSKSQEERLPVTHMEQLLGLVGRFAFSDSQLCDLRETVSPPSLRERTSDRATSQSSRCQLCQVRSVDGSLRLFAMTSD